MTKRAKTNGHFEKFIRNMIAIEKMACYNECDSKHKGDMDA